MGIYGLRSHLAHLARCAKMAGFETTLGNYFVWEYCFAWRALNDYKRDPWFASRFFTHRSRYWHRARNA